MLAFVQDGAEPKPAVFDPAVDAQAALAHAVEVAAKKHKRALIVWGEEREDDVALFDALRRGKTEAWPFYYEYELVAVDASQAATAKALGVDAAKSPALTVLDAEGKRLAHAQAAPFREGDAWSTDALGAFLIEHAVEPLDAMVVLSDARKRAAAEKRNLLVHFGAPW